MFAPFLIYAQVVINFALQALQFICTLWSHPIKCEMIFSYWLKGNKCISFTLLSGQLVTKYEAKMVESTLRKDLEITILNFGICLKLWAKSEQC